MTAPGPEKMCLHFCTEAPAFNGDYLPATRYDLQDYWQNTNFTFAAYIGAKKRFYELHPGISKTEPSTCGVWCLFLRGCWKACSVKRLARVMHPPSCLKKRPKVTQTPFQKQATLTTSPHMKSPPCRLSLPLQRYIPPICPAPTPRPQIPRLRSGRGRSTGGGRGCE